MSRTERWEHPLAEPPRRLTDGQLVELLRLEKAARRSEGAEARAQAVLVKRRLAEGYVALRADDRGKSESLQRGRTAFVDMCRITNAGRERLRRERELFPARVKFLARKHEI